MRVPLLTFAAGLALCGAAQAATINVPADYPTIQGAIDASSNGDIIAIAAGTYYEHDVNANGKEIIISGSMNDDGSPATKIDAQQQGHVLVAWSAEVSSTSFQNLVLAGGHSDLGGGMHNDFSSPSLVNCIFQDNVATEHGGGIFNFSSSPTLEYCTFTNNSAMASGGGIYNYNSASSLAGCSFTGNKAAYGGGVRNQNSFTTFESCTFIGNTAESDTYGYGGGMANYQSNPALEDCTFEDNMVITQGGGIYNYKGIPMLTNTTVCGNDPNQVHPEGSYDDGGGNTIADICPADCDGDINGDGVVDVMDLLAVIADWGSPYDVTDLLLVIDAWGPCP